MIHIYAKTQTKHRQGYISTLVIYLDMLFNIRGQELHSAHRALSSVHTDLCLADLRIDLPSGPVDQTPGIPWYNKNIWNGRGFPLSATLDIILDSWTWVDMYWSHQLIFKLAHIAINCRFAPQVYWFRMGVTKYIADVSITNKFVTLKSKNWNIWWNNSASNYFGVDVGCQCLKL